MMMKQHRNIYLVEQTRSSMLTVPGSVLDAEGTKMLKSMYILQRQTRGKHRFNLLMLATKLEVNTKG